jgi:hypothetical protein
MPAGLSTHGVDFHTVDCVGRVAAVAAMLPTPQNQTTTLFDDDKKCTYTCTKNDAKASSGRFDVRAVSLLVTKSPQHAAVVHSLYTVHAGPLDFNLWDTAYHTFWPTRFWPCHSTWGVLPRRTCNHALSLCLLCMCLIACPSSTPWPRRSVTCVDMEVWSHPWLSTVTSGPSSVPTHQVRLTCSVQGSQ